MAEQQIGYVEWEAWGLELVMERGTLRKLLFVDKGRAAKAPEPEMAVARLQLLAYLRGSAKGFTLELEPKGTRFQQDVWKALREIPYGETLSYKQLAESIGRPMACRAVGQAAHRNPLPILIPCHRLVGADGSLTGYAGGIELKRRLLDLERQNQEQK